MLLFLTHAGNDNSFTNTTKRNYNCWGQIKKTSSYNIFLPKVSQISFSKLSSHNVDILTHTDKYYSPEVLKYTTIAEDR